MNYYKTNIHVATTYFTLNVSRMCPLITYSLVLSFLGDVFVKN